MAIRITIWHGTHLPGEDFFTREWVDGSYLVDLISYNELEFVEEDLDVIEAAASLGLDDYTVPLEIYTKYTGDNGFQWFLRKNITAFHQALEEQGYEKFNRGEFSKPEFFTLLVDLVGGKRASSAQRMEALHIIEKEVDISDKDQGILPQDHYRKLLLTLLKHGRGNASQLIEFLQPFYVVEDEEGDRIYDEEYAKALVLALSYASRFDTNDILDELELYIDESDIDYTSTPIYEYGANDELWENTDKYENKIKVLGHPMFEWEQIIQSEIIDPIGFYAHVTDFAEHDSTTWGMPEQAQDLLSHFGIDEIEHDDPDDPEHPESDEDGDYAVLYVREYDGEEQLVPYDSEATAREAMELSKYIIDNSGEDWEMTLLERKTEEEIEEQEQQRAFLRRQLTLPGKVFEPEQIEEDPIFDEWRVYDEDDDEDDEDE